jgi:hypothetical protein
MRKIEKRTETTKPVTCEVLVEVVCEMCTRSYRNTDTDWVGQGGEVMCWDARPYTISKTALFVAEGSNYPEGGYATTRYVDICPECMETKVFPWLEAQGVKIEKSEVDW